MADNSTRLVVLELPPILTFSKLNSANGKKGMYLVRHSLINSALIFDVGQQDGASPENK